MTHINIRKKIIDNPIFFRYDKFLGDDIEADLIDIFNPEEYLHGGNYFLLQGYLKKSNLTQMPSNQLCTFQFGQDALIGELSKFKKVFEAIEPKEKVDAKINFERPGKKTFRIKALKIIQKQIQIQENLTQ